MRRGISVLSALALSAAAMTAHGQGAVGEALGKAPQPKLATPPPAASVRPGTGAGSDASRAALAAAVSAGDVGAVMALGGSPLDIAQAHATAHPALAEFIACGVADARFITTGGRLGVTLTSSAPSTETIPGATSITDTASFYPPALADAVPPPGATVRNLGPGVSIGPEGGALLAGSLMGDPGVSFGFNMTMSRRAAPAQAAPQGPVKGQTLAPSPALAEAIAAHDTGEILRNGGNAVDLALAMQVGNNTLRNGAAADPSTARLIQYDGATALGVAGGGGGDGGRIFFYGPEIRAYVPPGGVASLPTLGQAFGGPEPAPPPATPPPPPPRC